MKALHLIIYLSVIAVLLYVSRLEKQKKKLQEQRRKLKLDYPEIVGNMAVFVSAGMPIKYAWNKISARYSTKRNEKEHPGFELFVTGTKRMADGESERSVYHALAGNAGIIEYGRLSRLLVQNLEKGSRALAPLLEDETEAAFVERKRMALKSGEEAGTKMLFPMMLMMGVVMAIVMTPALLNFKV